MKAVFSNLNVNYITKIVIFHFPKHKYFQKSSKISALDQIYTFVAFRGLHPLRAGVSASPREIRVSPIT